MSKRYAIKITNGTVSGVSFAGPRMYETLLTSGLYVQTSGVSVELARQSHEKLAKVFGAGLAGPTVEVPAGRSAG